MAQTHRSSLILILVALCILVLLAIIQHRAYSDTPTPDTRTFLGEPHTVGHGTIRTWVTVDPDRLPLAFGVTFTEGALTGLPATDTEYPLRFPAQADETGFTHFVMNWNPHGHIPQAIYGAPHFDFHFYLISPEVRGQITATGEDLARVHQAPAPAEVPRGYVAAPGGHEPRMGAHWVDPASPEFHGQPFGETFIYGFYGGHLAFLEPMVTLAYLRSRATACREISQPAAYPKPGFYPTQYLLSYDPRARSYTLAMRNLHYALGQ